jgi:hypothetical protein
MAICKRTLHPSSITDVRRSFPQNNELNDFSTPESKSDVEANYRSIDSVLDGYQRKQGVNRMAYGMQ